MDLTGNLRNDCINEEYDFNTVEDFNQLCDIDSDNSDETSCSQKKCDETCNDINSDTYSFVSGDENFEESFSSDESCSEDAKIKFNSVMHEIMFDGHKLTVQVVLTMIVAFCLRFQISKIARAMLIQMISIFAGPRFENFSFSDYHISKMFDPPDKTMIYNYFCSNCNKKIVYSTSKKKFKKGTYTCEECKNKMNITLNSKNYFISVDLEYQLKLLLSQSDIEEHIINHKPVNYETVGDIYSSDIYKQIAEKHTNIQLTTFNFSTDGAPLTKSGKRGFWPLQVIINALPPRLRFKNVLLAGILSCTSEPNNDLVNLYFSKFIEQTNNLYYKGIDFITSSGKFINLKFIAFGCAMDTIARPLAQNRKRFNAYFGCSWCYDFGYYLMKNLKKIGMRYPMRENSELRTDSSHKIDVATANSKRNQRPNLKDTTSRGVIGDSCLSKIPFFDMIWSFVYDYMHGVLIGAETQIFKHLTANPQCKFKLTNKEKNLINARLMSIRPTQEIHRHQLPIKDRANWKASQVKSWLLYYSLVCFDGILKPEALKHYSLFVKCTYILLKAENSEEELLQCELDFIQFVADYELHYGVGAMTFIVHSLCHIVESIRKCGSMWANSTFPFESNIYHLKKNCTGPKGMDQQITKKSLTLLKFKTGNTKCESEVAQKFNNELFIPRKLTTFYEYGQNDVVFIGKAKLKTEDTGSSYKEYQKCIYNGKVLHSVEYKMAVLTDDTMIELKSNKVFGQIMSIMNFDGECYLQLSIIQLAQEKPFDVPHIEKIESQDERVFVKVHITEMKSKVMHLELENARYLCRFPNDFEIQ